MEETRQLSEEETSVSFGTYTEEWKGTSIKRDYEYTFIVSFGDGNREVTIHFHTTSPKFNDELNIQFELDKVLLEPPVKKHVYLKNGFGSYSKTERGNTSTQELKDQNMILFITGPRMAFGINMPNLMLHDLPLKSRILYNPEG